MAIPREARDPLSQLHWDIASQPDDLALRERLAELYHNRGTPAALARAELIRLQLLPSPGAFKLREAARLIREWWQDPEWKPICSQPEPSYWHYHRGCIEDIRMKASDLLAATDIFDFQPVRYVHVEPTSRADLRKFLVQERPRVAALNLTECEVDDTVIDELLQGPLFAGLRWLALNDNPAITRQGVRALAAAPGSSLQYVELNGVADSPIADVDDHLPAVGVEIEAALSGRIAWFHPQPVWASSPLDFLAAT